LLTSLFIRSQIDALQDGGEDEDKDENLSEIQSLQKIGLCGSGSFGNVFLGAAEPPRTFRDLEQNQHQDPAFQRFRIRFASFLDTLLRRPDSPIQLDTGRLTIGADELVSIIATDSML
jgi:hypothetical protein